MQRHDEQNQRHGDAEKREEDAPGMSRDSEPRAAPIGMRRIDGDGGKQDDPAQHHDQDDDVGGHVDQDHHPVRRFVVVKSKRDHRIHHRRHVPEQADQRRETNEAQITLVRGIDGIAVRHLPEQNPAVHRDGGRRNQKALHDAEHRDDRLHRQAEQRRGESRRPDGRQDAHHGKEADHRHRHQAGESDARDERHRADGAKSVVERFQSGRNDW